MHLLLDLIPHNLPAAGVEAVPHALRQRAAALFQSYAADRPSFARSVLKIAQVIPTHKWILPVAASALYTLRTCAESVRVAKHRHRAYKAAMCAMQCS